MSNKISKFDIFMNGIIAENPTFVQLIGMCPTLGVTTSAKNGFAMGIASMLVLIASNVAISILKKAIPDKIRIPAFVVVIATFVTLVGMILKAYAPEIDNTLGLFIPLIVVNCLILGRAEAFASKNSVSDSFVDGVGMGLGFTLALTILGIVREILGNGSVFDINILGSGYKPALIMIMPPGAFFALGFIIAFIGVIKRKNKKNA